MSNVILMQRVYSNRNLMVSGLLLKIILKPHIIAIFLLVPITHTYFQLDIFDLLIQFIRVRKHTDYSVKQLLLLLYNCFVIIIVIIYF